MGNGGNTWENPDPRLSPYLERDLGDSLSRPTQRQRHQSGLCQWSQLVCVCVACAAVYVRLSAHMFLKCISVGVRAVQLTCLHLQYNHTPSAIVQNLDLNPRKHVRTIKLQICSLVREKCVKPFIVSALNIYF